MSCFLNAPMAIEESKNENGCFLYSGIRLLGHFCYGLGLYWGNAHMKPQLEVEFLGRFPVNPEPLPTWERVVQQTWRVVWIGLVAGMAFLLLASVVLLLAFTSYLLMATESVAPIGAPSGW